MSWSPSAMPDLTGTAAVVTGANSGIGYHTALELARHGADVTLAVRNAEKGGEAADKMRAELGDRGAGERRGARPASARRPSRRSPSGGRRARPAGQQRGVMAPPRYRDDRGRLRAAVRHQPPRPLRADRAAAAACSAAPARGWSRCRPSPTATARERARRQPARGLRAAAHVRQLQAGQPALRGRAPAAGTEAGTNLVSVASHPGVSHTNLVTSEQGLGAIPGIKQVAPLFMRLAFQSAKAGAEPSLLAATADEPFPYTGPQGFQEWRGRAGSAKRGRLARDEDLAAKLWTTSEELTGVTFAWPT